MIGQKLKELRIQKGYTVSQLCDKIGFNVNTYNKYESNKNDVSTETLCKLADFYEVTADYILGRNQPNSDNQPTSKQIENYIQLRDLNPIEERLLRAYIALPEPTRIEIMNFLKQAVSDKEKQNN